jgi:hypothetical protein
MLFGFVESFLMLRQPLKNDSFLQQGFEWQQKLQNLI